jgi:hypothetical protein
MLEKRYKDLGKRGMYKPSVLVFLKCVERLAFRTEIQSLTNTVEGHAIFLRRLEKPTLLDVDTWYHTTLL